MPAIKYVSLRYHGPQALIVELGREVVDGDEFDVHEDLVEKLCQAHGIEQVGQGKPHVSEHNQPTAAEEEGEN